jgi:hypothetical protein
MDRRLFLGASGVAAMASCLGTFPATARVFSPAETDMILQVARAGAVFPIEFPSFGEPGPAWARATPIRLARATARLTAARRPLVRSGAGLLISRGLFDRPRQDLLDGIGREAGGPGVRGLTALVALAIATVSRHFDPNSEEAAEVWVDGLGRLHRLHRQAELAGAARR